MEDQIRQFETHDKLKLCYRHWLSAKDAPCVVYLHGLESHMAWFSGMADFLNKVGINVYAFDRRGSGLNQRQRGHLYSYHYLFDDIKVFLDLVRKEHPKSKIFLLGLCLGGKIAVNFFLFYPDFVDGLILISPSIENKLKFSFLQKLDIIFSSIFRPKKMFKVPIEDHMFTANKTYQDFIKNDPLRLRYVTGRFYWEIFRMDLHLKKICHKIHVPVLVMLAGIDEIIDTESVNKWYDLVESKDKTLKLYKEYYHLLLYEENAGEIMEYIASWIQTRSIKTNA